MSLDTAQKRGSVLGLSLPWRPWLAVPDGTLASTDRLSIIYYASAVAPGDFVAPPPAAPQSGAGRAKRKRRYQVEIDGEVFDAESVDEALEILAKAKEQAQAIADDAVAKAVKAKRRQPRKVAADAVRALQVPTIDAPGIQDAVASVLADIRATYERAAKTIEIELAMRRRDAAIEEDDEEILLLL